MAPAAFDDLSDDIVLVIFDWVIALELGGEELKKLSLANKRLRYLATSFIFRSFRMLKGLECIEPNMTRFYDFVDANPHVRLLAKSFNFCPLPKTTGTLRRAGDYTKFTSYNRYFNMLSSFENVETLVVHIAIINNSEFMRRIGMCKKVLLPQVKTLKTCVSGASLLRHCPNIENIVLFDENHRSKFQFHPWLSALATTTTLQSLQMCTITPENLYGLQVLANLSTVQRLAFTKIVSAPFKKLIEFLRHFPNLQELRLPSFDLICVGYGSAHISHVRLATARGDVRQIMEAIAWSLFSAAPALEKVFMANDNVLGVQRSSSGDVVAVTWLVKTLKLVRFTITRDSGMDGQAWKHTAEGEVYMAYIGA